MQAPGFTFDLHVLGTPPAFILSQDQTLRKVNLRLANTVARKNRFEPAHQQTCFPVTFQLLRFFDK